MPDRERTTQLLNRVAEGAGDSQAEVMNEIHAELKKLARMHMAREGPAHTLQPTALVHEAWIRLIDAEAASWESRHHFYSMASKVMRSILVDHARRRKAEKRGGDRARVALADRDEGAGELGADDLLDVHDALEQLARVDGELASTLELRYFGGLAVKDIAETTGTPKRTVERRLRAATAWVRERIDGQEAD